jgi:tRNA threonylcarbamoyladenosine biosynthesis protein TsaE
MKQPVVIRYTLEDLPRVARNVQEVIAPYAVVALIGDLGAGKTTLVRELLTQAGVVEVVTSPTFTYVNCYKTVHDHEVYHFDLYRISTIEQFFGLGLESFLYQPLTRAYVEWPVVIAPLLQRDVCTLTVRYGDQINERIIHIEGGIKDTHD